MAILLYWIDPSSGQVTHYLAVSEAAPQNMRACATFSPRNWWYSTWDGSDFATYAFPEVAPSGGTFSDLQNEPALAGAVVQAVAVFMGVVDTIGDGNTLGGDDVLNPGSAIVDNITIFWQESGTTYGGTYDLEQPWPNPYDFDDTHQDQWHAWTGTGLWNLVNSADLYGESAEVQNFPSDGYAVYFGAANPNTGKGSYNGTGSPVRGVLTSPDNNVNPGDKYVNVSFKYYREVESYDGVYDQTYVQIKFDGSDWLSTGPWSSNPWKVDDPPNGWKTIWYEDSSTPPEETWTSVSIASYPDADGNPDPSQQIVIPPDATKVWIRFCFDSIDGYNNDHLGWLIDDIVKTHNPEPSKLEILTDSLPQGAEGYEYGDLNFDGTLDQIIQLRANKPGVRWEIVSVTKEGEGHGQSLPSLPSRLALEHGTGIISGRLDPGTAGTYEVTIRATCGHDHPAEKTYSLAIRSGVGSNATNIIHEEDFSSALGWKVDGTSFGPTSPGCPNLWHETSATAIKGVSDPAGQYGEVAYFGKDESTNPNYNCPRAKGVLTSPYYPISVDAVGEEIVLGFKSWREVESYDGKFDKTWVQVRFEGGEWKTVWYKDSQDPSKKEWTWEEVHTGLIVPNPPSRKVQVRFCFDSVDGYNNDQVGWVIDEVTLYAGSAQLSIVNECPMPGGSVGQYYKEELHASGGPTGVRVFEIDGQLPPGLTLIEKSTPRTWWIEGVPREAGTYNFTIKVTVYDSLGNKKAWASKPCSITVAGKVVLLYEDFEDDPQWTWNDLWHRTDDGGVQGVDKLGPDNHAAYYGKDDHTDPNYDTGQRTTGTLALLSPVIDLTGATNGVGAVGAVKVSFDYWREVEAFSEEFDFTKVQVKLDDGNWTTIWEKNSTDPSGKTWTTEKDIPAFLTGGAKQLWIRFAFDSVDKWYNKYIGWLVDNVRVEKADTEGAQPLSALKVTTKELRPRNHADAISVMNIPNPVRDVHTTTFTVRGVGIEAIKIQVFDLDENLVYEKETPGNELTWHTVNDYGEYLANGVYFYRALVKIGGKWITTKFQKLVILR